MTLRQFYLLLAEWHGEERRKDRRAYLVICSNLRSPPAAEKLFPNLALLEQEEQEEEDPDQDLMRFRALTAELTPYAE